MSIVPLIEKIGIIKHSGMKKEVQLQVNKKLVNFFPLHFCLLLFSSREKTEPRAPQSPRSVL